MIKRRGGQCEANQIELASTPSWATTNRAGTRSINGRIENQQLLAKEDRFFQTKPFIWKKLKELTPGWVDIGTPAPLLSLTRSRILYLPWQLSCGIQISVEPDLTSRRRLSLFLKPVTRKS